ncbi:MAG: ester cyclase [Actinomycetota bacterium]|nr:ester cyclase [Actinomycetota bacterium]
MAASEMQSESERAKAVVRRWNDEGWSGGNYELAQEIIAPVMTVHGAGGQAVGMGPDGLVDLIKTWRTAFPDGYMTVDDIIVEGDLVGIRNTWHGTHQESFYGIPASGKEVHVTSVGLDRVTNGQVAEGWGELDMVGMMQQLGAMPMAGPGAVSTGRSSEWGPSSTVSGDATTSPEEYRAIVARFVEALGHADEAALADLVDEAAFVDHNPVWGTDDWAGVIAGAKALRAAFPDLEVKLDTANMVAEGNQVVAHSLLSGTQTGEFLGVAPTGKAITWSHTDFVRIAGGKVVERWVSADTLTLFQQIGLLPGGS